MAGPAIATRPWDLAPEQEEELFRSLRFDYHKWDTFACGNRLVRTESLVLDEALHLRIVDAVEALHQALTRFERSVAPDPDVLRRLAIPEPLHLMIGRERGPALQCARYDLFPTVDGRLMVSEFNEDVPGGFNESHGIPELLGDPGEGLRWEAGLRAGFLAAFRSYGPVALLYATAYSEDLQHMLILEAWLRQEGHPTVLGSPAHLTGRRRPKVLGERIDAAFRFYPGEWMARLPNTGSWRRHGPTLPMMNPLRHLVRQSKLMFALWRDHPDTPDEDRALIDRHCPRTEPFAASLLERLRDEPESWVLKQAFGRMGDSVVMGNLVPPKEWEATLAEALRKPADWLAQERFDVVPVDFEGGPLYPALGAYVVNGRFAGYYSRAAPKPLITHEAYHVATLVRAA